jgi:hypothetical protein
VDEGLEAVTVSREAYRDLVRENEGLKEQLDAAREREKKHSQDLDAYSAENQMLKEQHEEHGSVTETYMRVVENQKKIIADLTTAASESARACQTKLIAMREAHPHGAVKRFHEAFGVALGGSWWSTSRRALRQRLIIEEYKEWHAAEAADDPGETLDAIVDLVYVLVGAALEYGWDFAGAFAAVQAANMAKLGPDGKPIVRADGKILKPEGWKPADLTPFLAALAAPKEARAAIKEARS